MERAPPLILEPPAVDALPLLFDSPHSGRDYPPDWITPLERIELRRGEDALVDELLAGAPRHGITLLAARFPRCYIDVNREIDDIDPALLAEAWPGPSPLKPTEKSRKGLGLIRRYVVPGVAIVDAPLSIADVRSRIQAVYLPYHRALAERIESLRERFGFVWHVDWHSMKSRGNAMTPDGAGASRPDMVVGDLDGTSADPGLVDLAVSQLRSFGYRVTVNDPYKGAAIVRRYGKPAERRSTIQIEINRALYLDEASVEPTEGFGKLKASLETLMSALAAAVRAR
ncbi:MAG TPA: N-formylglutamate amidohydrolase [Casimicrobiaceae bacterium]|nr:N-formylglutamate amidohydrolase [Casimicrobiaceae bacterium]